MKYCRFCGSELIDGQCRCPEFQASIGAASYQSTKDPFLIRSFHINTTSFSGFVSSIRDLTGISEPNSTAADPYERNIPIVPDCVQPEENEIIVKQYNLAQLRTRLKFMKAEGRMMVTNRRVLFRATGTSLTGHIIQQHQFDLDELSGIEMHKDYKFSLLNFFGSVLLLLLATIWITSMFLGTSSGAAVALGFILGVAGLVPTFLVYKHFWLKLLAAIFSFAGFQAAYSCSGESGLLNLLRILSGIILLVDLIIVCFVPNLVIKIKTKGGTGAIVIGSKEILLRRRTGDEYSGFAEVLPWEDTVMAMDELGTMIDDLKKHGDYAIEKWSR